MIEVVTVTKGPPEGIAGACAVYRFSDSNGDFLYVGSTKDPQKRIATHSHSSKWFGMAAKVSVSWHKSKEDALDAEAKAIFECKPTFNKSCALRRVSEPYRVKTRVMVLRPKKEKKALVEKRKIPQKPLTLAGNLIKLWAKQGGRKFGWLAAQVPVTPNTMSGWINGHAIPNAIYRNRLADITGADVRDVSMWEQS